MYVYNYKYVTANTGLSFLNVFYYFIDTPVRQNIQQMQWATDAFGKGE